jgi:chromosome segregation ATPase
MTDPPILLVLGAPPSGEVGVLGQGDAERRPERFSAGMSSPGHADRHRRLADTVLQDSMVHILRASQRSPERGPQAARFSCHGDGGSVARVASEIDVLRASQAAREALASQRSRNDSARWKADDVDADMAQDQLFSELGYVRQERDLIAKEKKALQHLLAQAGEEIRVLVAAEQRHVEELRGWVRQRDDLLQEKAQAEQTATVCHGLRLRLEEVLSQHRNDKHAWEEEVRDVLREKSAADAAAETLRKELEAARKELEIVKTDLNNERTSANNAKAAAENERVSMRAMLAQRDDKMASLERERDRLVQENCSCR